MHAAYVFQWLGVGGPSLYTKLVGDPNRNAALLGHAGSELNLAQQQGEK
jgi:hypothetical protein